MPDDKQKVDLDKVAEAMDKLPDGSYRGACPSCGIQIRLQKNWGSYVARGVIMTVVAVVVTILCLWLIG